MYLSLMVLGIAFLSQAQSFKTFTNVADGALYKPTHFGVDVHGNLSQPVHMHNGLLRFHTNNLELVTSPQSAVEKCAGVRVVYESSTTQIPRSNVRPPQCIGGCDSFCKTHKHWEYCKMSIEDVTRRNPISTKNVITEWTSAYIDYGSCHPDIAGYVFDRRCVAMFQFYKKCNTNVFKAQHIHDYAALATTLQVYSTANGHYPHEQFPALLRLMLTLPEEVKILTPYNNTPNGGIGVKYVDELINMGLLNKTRIVSWEGHNHLYYGNKVYHHRPFPFEEPLPTRGAVTRGQADLQLVRQTLVPNPKPRAERNDIVLLWRDPHGSRGLSNGDELVSHLAQYGNVVKFVPTNRLRVDIEVFQKAKLVIGVHGAGFANLMFCSPETIIVEIGYETGMPFPQIYYLMADALQLDYWVMVGKGGYNTRIVAPLDQIDKILENKLTKISFD